MKVQSMVICLILTAMAASGAAAWDAEEEKKAQEAVAEFRKADPKMEAFFDKAYGYAVFPTVGKGGIGIGGAYGSGLVYAKGAVTGRTSLKQVSVGFQWGGQAYREIIFFEGKENFEDFTAGNFELSGQVSAVAVTAGIAAETKYSNGVAIFTMAKGGLMYEAAVAGQKFSYDPKKDADEKKE
jgi:lipid-binding SYLF domain-containing protein